MKYSMTKGKYVIGGAEVISIEPQDKVDLIFKICHLVVMDLSDLSHAMTISCVQTANLVYRKDGFTNLETTKLRIYDFFREAEFVYSFLCTMDENNNIQLRRFVVITSQLFWPFLDN